MSHRYVRCFANLGTEDVPPVGGKDASHGGSCIDSSSPPLGVKVPNGSAAAADANRDTVGQARLWDELSRLMAGVDKSEVTDLARRARRAREFVYGARLPDELAEGIKTPYNVW